MNKPTRQITMAGKYGFNACTDPDGQMPLPMEGKS